MVGTVQTADATHGELAQMMVGRETLAVSADQADAAAGNGRCWSCRNLGASDDKGLPALKEVSLRCMPARSWASPGSRATGRSSWPRCSTARGA